jgi:hypothetical protein
MIQSRVRAALRVLDVVDDLRSMANDATAARGERLIAAAHELEQLAANTLKFAAEELEERI